MQLCDCLLIVNDATKYSRYERSGNVNVKAYYSVTEAAHCWGGPISGSKNFNIEK